jgi:3-phenylpropionate/trans-cinnamate dioxygenase ferredoxin reductase subunit
VSIVIVGGGLAGQRCAETLRRAGYEGRVTIVCGEPHAPYDRPPLSKEALTGEARIFFRPEAWYRDNAVELLLGTRATGLDAVTRELHLDDGSVLPYDELVVATGSRPRRLPLLERFENVSVLRTLDDARELRARLTPGAHLAIVGAGFIGQEVAASARKCGADATMIEALPAPLATILGHEQGAWFAHLHRSEGVDLRLGRTLVEATGNGRVEALRLDDEPDHVLVCVGVDPDVAWLGVDTLAVDDDGRTELPHVWGAGDAAGGGHWESAARQGVRAARAILGLDPGAAAPSSFWSDLYGTRVNYLGEARLADSVRVEGDPEARDFTATFTRRGRAVALLLVGRPHELPAARAALAA